MNNTMVNSMLPKSVTQSKAYKVNRCLNEALFTPSMSPMFSGDPFAIREKIKNNQQKVEAEDAQKDIEESRKKAESKFKAIGDTVVWQSCDTLETLNVADMIAYLSQKRPEDSYPGYGRIETLAKDFPGMDAETLKKAVETLHNKGKEPCYIGMNYVFNLEYFWLRPEGKEMLNKVYPDIQFPSNQECYTSSAKSIWSFVTP